MITELKPHRPELIISDKHIELFNNDTEIKPCIALLEAGKPVLITSFYSNGLLLLKALKAHVKKKMPNDTFIEQRKYRAEYHKLSNRILVEIKDHKLVVKKAPIIGWLKILYPETSDFLFPFPQVQGLNSAWQWYKNGISIPVLRNKIHPYYGTYFPTRFDHLELFDQWLKRYEGYKKSAIDIGIGSGVLALQMVKHGFQKVYGTDTNPNAIIGLTEFMGDTKLSRKIELDYGSLFGRFKHKTELIVFNPPWLPQAYEANKIDSAMYYNNDLFEAFFDAAKQHLLPDGKLVLLFSNLAQITHVTKDHPIENELANGGRFKLGNVFKKKVKSSSKNTKRNLHWRASEIVELWELTL